MFQAPTIPLDFPRRPAPPIPPKKPTISEPSPSENIYLAAMLTPPSLVNETDNLSKSPTANYEEIPFGDKVTKRIMFNQ